MSAIFDLDGTLITKGVQPNGRLILLCNNTPNAYIVTGRPESERAATVQLLKKYGIRYKKLLMNNASPDKMGQIHSKRANAQSILRSGPVTLAVDDDPVARLLYKKLGIPKVIGP